MVCVSSYKKKEKEKEKNKKEGNKKKKTIAKTCSDVNLSRSFQRVANTEASVNLIKISAKG